MIQFDERSLIVGGKRVQLVSGAFHYFRVPHEQWADRLEKSRRGGLNMIETVVPWNVHEDREGTFDFHGDYDLEGFLELCHAMGLYTFVRPSPYICAEWDNGGLPAWLVCKRGIAYRRSNPVFLEYLTRWYDELIPRIAAQQWTCGGSVVLVQIENEYAYFGDAQERSYMEFQRDALLQRGIDVPLTTCDWPGKGMHLPGLIEGGNCGSDFADAVARLRRAQPGVFAFISELWLAWFDSWGGSHHSRPGSEVAQALKEVLSVGGHYNFYMWAGGTNPGYTAGRTRGTEWGSFITTSYDYDAPIAETGALTPKFYECRLVNGLATTCAEVFAGSQEVTSDWVSSDADVQLTARQGSRGTALFLRNASAEERCVHLVRGDRRFPTDFDWSLGPGATVILLADFRLTDDTVIALCSAEVLALSGTRLLVYGEAGQRCEVWTSDRGMTACFPEDTSALVQEVGSGAIVLLNRATAEVTWVEGEHWHTDPNYGVRAARSDLPTLHWQSADVLEVQRDRTGAESPVLCSLERFGVLHGYGWYRTRFAHPGGTTALVLTEVHDRATVFVNGRRQGVIGSFAGFSWLPIQTRPGINELWILADPLGRYTFTARLGEWKGLGGSAYIGGQAEDLPGWSVRGDRLELPLDWGAGTGLLVRLWGLADRPQRVGIDGHIVHTHRSSSDDDDWVEIDLTSWLRPGGNRLWVDGATAFPPHVRAVRFQTAGELAGPWWVTGGVVGEQGGVTIDPTVFDALPWAPASSEATGVPTLHRATFDLSLADAAVSPQLRMAGLSKGVVWLNGHNLGRFWEIGPQKALVIPRPWLTEHNTLVVFDEDGRSPHEVRLIQREGFVSA